MSATVGVPDPRLATLAGSPKAADHPDPARPSSTSPAWCAAPPRARASATSSCQHPRGRRHRHVVRCFEDGDVTHVEGRIDPLADIETVETELMLADLDSLENASLPWIRRPREATRKPAKPLSRMMRALELLRAGRPARLVPRGPRRNAPSRHWGS
jgi:hypothetical protein